VPVKLRADPDIGRRVAEIRKARGMSQAELATAVGTDKTTIANYEHGRSSPMRRLDQLAVALQVKPDDLLNPPGSPVPPRRLDVVTHRALLEEIKRNLTKTIITVSNLDREVERHAELLNFELGHHLVGEKKQR
jgi:transcriptional regulator with XRE-family HTH domain